MLFRSISLNIKMVYGQLEEWLVITNYHWSVVYVVIPVAIFTGIMLMVTFIKPFVKSKHQKDTAILHQHFTQISDVSNEKFKRIAIALDFSKTDSSAIKQALILGGRDATYILIHTVETVGAFIMGEKTTDFESEFDKKNIQLYKNNLEELGYQCVTVIGYGNPKKIIPQITKNNNAEILVMGAHGHHFFKDMILGTTIESVRHALDIPVLVVR